MIAQTSTWFKITKVEWYTPARWRIIWVVTWVSLMWDRKQYIWTWLWLNEVSDAIEIAEYWAKFYS